MLAAAATPRPDRFEEVDGGPDIAEMRLLIVSDGRTGSENQSLGVAETLGFKDPEVFTLRRLFTSKWLSWLPVDILFENVDKLEPDVDRLDVLIGAGFQVSRVLRHLKKKNPGLFTVCLMRPSGKVSDYDVVAVPQHDNFKKAVNVVVTLGSANRITKARLASEADRWRKRLAAIPTPRIAVLVGGATKRGGLKPAEVENLLGEVLKIAKKANAGLLVTASRRTGPEATDTIRKMLEKSGLAHFFWAPGDPQGGRDNPYLAYLALADAVVVTSDSVSMVSEAATAGKPVYVWKLGKVAKKFRALFEGLEKQGRIRFWNGQMNLRAPAAGLMDTLMIAGFVRARWNKRAMARR